MNMSRKPPARYCRCLLLVMWMALCNGTEDDTALSSLLNRVYSVIEDKSVIPFCFTTTLLDLTCFWESNRSNASSYHFSYYKPEMQEMCNLKTVATAYGTWWHVCQFPAEHVEISTLSPYEIAVIDSLVMSNFSRNCTIEKVVYLEPITHITVKELLNTQGFLIILNNTNTEMPSSSLMYEVKYASEKINVQKMFQKVEAQQGYVKLLLDDIVKGAEYTLSVRVKADGEFDGYWSQWTDVHVQISDVMHVVHIILYLIALLVLVVAIILLTTC